MAEKPTSSRTMQTTLGAPSGALGGSNGAQSGTESRISTLIVPLNRSPTAYPFQPVASPQLAPRAVPGCDRGPQSHSTRRRENRQERRQAFALQARQASNKDEPGTHLWSGHHPPRVKHGDPTRTADPDGDVLGSRTGARSPHGWAVQFMTVLLAALAICGAFIRYVVAKGH